METVSRLADLESVIATPELRRRPARAPDYEGETRGLASLAEALPQSSEAILRALAAAVLSSCRAGSAGVSLIEENGLTSRWYAVTGELAPRLRGTMPRALSPCGAVVDRNALQLFSFPQRHFTYFAGVNPAIVEALLMPFSIEGRPAGAIWVVSHDDQRLFDAEDARLVDRLGSFAAAAYQLRTSADAAQRAGRRTEDFVALLAHEMQTPLYAMQLASELISRKPGAAEEGNGVIRRQVAQLQRLVGDLLDIARIRHGNVELRQERMDLSSIAQAAAEASAPLVRARRHAVTFTPPAVPLTVMADPARITQVICNLLNNAAKFTPPGGHLRISLAAEDSLAVLRVADDGVGMAEETLSRVFEPYAQFRTVDVTVQPGLGLGLGLARSLAELHGGALEARSAGLAKGSEFILRLPLIDVATQTAVAAPRSPRLAPATTIVGDLSDRSRVIQALGIKE